MPELNITYDSADDIPDVPVRDLFAEKDGKWVLSSVRGIKTAEDVSKVQRALENERNAHRETKGRLEAWSDLEDPEDVRAKLERLPELEAAAADKLDDAKIEETVSRRVEAALKGKMAPLQKQVAKLTEERDELARLRDDFVAKDLTRRLHDTVRDKSLEAKMLPSAVEDALVLAERSFEQTEDGEFVTRDGCGVMPGCDVASWVSEMQEKRPHWWPESRGGGARGGRGGNGYPSNPFSREHFNMTEQARILREHGPERAKKMAEAAGTTVGGGPPPERKS